jgi:hypothetical protein
MNQYLSLCVGLTERDAACFLLWSLKSPEFSLAAVPDSDIASSTYLWTPQPIQTR